MSVINRRNRLVNFRLSDQELEALKQVCFSNGARSISDFARTAVLQSMHGPASPDASQLKIQHLDQKLNELEVRVSLLLQVVQMRGGERSSPKPNRTYAQSA